MPETKHITSLTPYAGSDDFHRIVYEENDSLHRLSFFLTADREKAEQCFASGLVLWPQPSSTSQGGQAHRAPRPTLSRTRKGTAS
jgi:hypothetical protein